MDYSGFYARRKKENSAWLPLKKAWRCRIAPPKPECGEDRPIHVEGHGRKHSQNDDGSNHGPYKGEPPNSVKKEMRERGIWDWDGKKQAYRERQRASRSQIFVPVAEAVVNTMIIAILLALGIELLYLIAGTSLVLA